MDSELFMGSEMLLAPIDGYLPGILLDLISFPLFAGVVPHATPVLRPLQIRA